MRIKALAAAAKEDGNIMLLDEADEEGQIVRQYVMLPGRAVFPLDGMPTLNEDTLLTVLDVPVDKRGDYEVDRSVVNERMKAMVADAKATDTVVERGVITICMGGKTMLPVISEGKVHFVGYDLLKVLADMRGLSIAERMVDGSRVFVLLHGMVTVGCLMPDMSFWNERGAEHLKLAGVVAKRVFDSWLETHPQA